MFGEALNIVCVWVARQLVQLVYSKVQIPPNSRASLATSLAEMTRNRLHLLLEFTTGNVGTGETGIHVPSSLGAAEKVEASESNQWKKFTLRRWGGGGVT